MKRSLSDIFKREYEVRLSVSRRDTIAPHAEQRRGAAILAPEGNEVFRGANPAGAEKTLALLRDLHPEVLRFEAVSPDFERWERFCREEEICPHIVFPPDMPAEQMSAAAEACAAGFSANDLRTHVRYYEIGFSPESIPFEDDAAMDASAENLKSRTKQLRKADPDAKIILGGIFPSGDSCLKAELWNRRLLEICGEQMDMLGVQIFPEGNAPDESTEGIEVNWTLAEEVRKGLGNLSQMIRETVPEREILTAVTGWGLRREAAQKRQDCVYWSSVYSALRDDIRQTALFECGPLFGRDGLLTLEDGRTFGNIFYQDMLIASHDLPIRLSVKETEAGKGIPAVLWDGVPGAFGGGEIPLLEIIASGSPDGKRLFLFMTNRSPFRLAVPRIRFYDMPDMHPVKAYILRSKNRMDENSAETPEKVYCKEVKLRNYRKMDHVTPEIPECSTACMLLE